VNPVNTASQPIALSVIVRIVSGTAFLEKTLCHLMPQIQGRPIQVIVPFVSETDGIQELPQKFSHVLFVDMGTLQTAARRGTVAAAHEIYDRAISVGMHAAQGNVVALLEDDAVPAPDWCEQVLAAQRLPYEIFGGAIEQAGSGVLNWAVYFLDFGRYQLPLREGPVSYLSDVNIAYSRRALEAVRDGWSMRYNEVTVNWALARQGFVLWQRPQMIVRQDRGKLVLSDLLVERFWWGRLFASQRVRELSLFARLFYFCFSPLLPFVMLARVTKKVLSGKRHRAKLLAAFPSLVLLTFTWSLGEAAGYATGRAE